MKTKIKKARCQKVMVVLNNELVTADLLREETYPPYGDFAEGPITYAIIKYDSSVAPEVMVPIDCVVFLKN